MVLLYNRFLFRSYHHLYKITDTKTGWFIYENKSTFNDITKLGVQNDGNVYYIKNKNNKLTEFNINDLKIDVHVNSYKDLTKLCDNYKIKTVYMHKWFMLNTVPPKIKSIIKHINDKLKQKCKDLTLIVDLAYKINAEFDSFDLNNPVICLLYKNSCISTITYYIQNKQLTIASDTDEKYRNNKYNSLLRAIAVIISQFYDVQELISNAINPISVYTLSKYFIVTYDAPFTKYLKNQKPTFELCKEYMDKTNLNVDIFIKISDENIQRAIHVYESLFDDKLKCP
jgi:hypothetical protein